MHIEKEAMDSGNIYDRYANQYAELIRNRNETRFNPYHDLVVPRLLALAGDVSGLTVLDAGCGEGHVARMLARRGAHVTAIDVSPRLVELARTVDPEVEIEYLTHDLSTPLPQYARRFDLIVSNLVLNDVSDYVGFANTLSAVIVDGGCVVLSMNNPYSAVIRDKVANYFESGKSIAYQGMAESGVPVLYYHRTLEQYIRAFRDAGFLLQGLSDVGPPEEGERAPAYPQRYYHFPFFTILEFIRHG